MAIALRPRLKPNSMISRYGSQPLTGRVFGGLGSAVTSLAGFDSSESAVTSLAGFDSSESVVTSLAGFAGNRRPHAPATESQCLLLLDKHRPSLYVHRLPSRFASGSIRAVQVLLLVVFFRRSIRCPCQARVLPLALSSTSRATILYGRF